MENTAKSLGVDFNADQHQVSGNLGAAVLSDANRSTNSMIQTYDNHLQGTIDTARRESEGLSDKERLAAIVAAILLWYTRFTRNQNRLSSVSEVGNSYNGQIQTVLAQNPQLASVAIARVMPESSLGPRPGVL